MWETVFGLKWHKGQSVTSSQGRLDLVASLWWRAIHNKTRRILGGRFICHVHDRNSPMEKTKMAYHIKWTKGGYGMDWKKWLTWSSKAMLQDISRFKHWLTFQLKQSRGKGPIKRLRMKCPQHQLSVPNEKERPFPTIQCRFALILFLAAIMNFQVVLWWGLAVAFNYHFI